MNLPMENMNKRQDAVLAFIERKNTASTREILCFLRQSIDSVARITLIRDLRKLLILGLIERTGAGRSIRYQAFGSPLQQEHLGMKHNPKLDAFIQARPHLVWYVSDLDQLSESSIVENTLNYGTWQDVQNLVALLGITEVASIFMSHMKQTRNNYRKEIANYFQLYFARYASH